MVKDVKGESNRLYRVTGTGTYVLYHMHIYAHTSYIAGVYVRVCVQVYKILRMIFLQW